ncbi:MAG: segregation/condensation protein A, partial [Candidatus Methylomirabilales bacterium]
LRRVDDQGVLTLVPRPVTTAERMVAILDQVTLQGSLTFEALFPPTVDRSLVIATFLALLELLRQGAVRVRQRVPFGEIVIGGAAA